MKKLFIFVSGILMGAIIFGYTVSYAKTGIHSVSAEYQNIKLVVEGKLVNAENEPFIIDGRVYVPLRTVAEALGKKVGWENSTVLVGTGDQSLLLDDLILPIERGVVCSKGSVINVNGVSYTKGFYVNSDSKSGTMSFSLDQRGVKGISGKIGLDDNSGTDQPVDVIMYLDDKKVWEGSLKKGDPPLPVDIVTTASSRILKIDFNNSAKAKVDFIDFIALF